MCTSGKSFCGTALQLPNNPIGCCHTSNKIWLICMHRVYIYSLYKSVSCLGDGKYLKSEGVKTMLLCPKVSAKYSLVTDLLPIYEVNTHPGHFLMEQAIFIVSHDLEVSASASIATFSKFNTLGVFVDDMEVLEVGFGGHEALLLLKASLTSTSALTDFVNASNRKLKVESSN